MKILHYFLGFPPYRTGGMTRLAYDLMTEQAKQGYDVIALWPSVIKSYNSNPKLKIDKNINGVKSVEVINPLPIPLLDGIKDIKAFTKKIDKNIYKNFLLREMPNIIHIHTLMGLHKEFIDVAQELGIKMIFTSHDFFGICPKVTLFKDKEGKVCKDDNFCLDCNKCNQNALSLNKIKLLQSPLYRRIKNNPVVTALRNKNRNYQDKISEKKKNNLDFHNYKLLREYYISILKKMDCIHFNSSLAKEVYSRYFSLPQNKVISLSHKDIKNQNIFEKEKREKFRFLYLNPAKKYKGFDFLINSFDQLYKEMPDSFELLIFSYTDLKRPYLKKICNKFSPQDLNHIFSKGDVLIAPSQWYETFGFTVLESLSYKTPVLVSNNVGAKDIIGRCGLVFNADNEIEFLKSVKQVIKEIDILNKNVQKVRVKEWSSFVQEMQDLYVSLIW